MSIDHLFPLHLYAGPLLSDGNCKPFQVCSSKTDPKVALTTSAVTLVQTSQTASNDLVHPSVAGNVPSVSAVRRLRTLRGGSQAQLVQANDGHIYAVKSFNNPQGRRTLVNEWIATILFRVCGISVAEQSPIAVRCQLLAELRADQETGRWWSADGALPHFGSRLPVNPDQHAIYDFLPDHLLSSVANLSDFAGALVLDTWLGNVDTRQVVFYRGQLKELPDRPLSNRQQRGMMAIMIDQGQCFNALSWQLNNCSPIKPFQWGNVYTSVAGLDSFGRWLDRIDAITRANLEGLRLTIPEEWIAGDETHLDRLFEDLIRRKAALPQLLTETRENYPVFFPNWQRG